MSYLSIRLARSIVLILAAGLQAQSETSPKGFLTTEGNGMSPAMIGYSTSAYGYGGSYLHIDSTNVGQARTLKALSLRRDGMLATNPKYVGRTVTLSIRMAHAGWSKLKLNSKQGEGEVLLAPWTTVLGSKSVSLPSLAQQPASAPASFSVLLQLDSYFAYNGSDALAFQILSSPSPDLAVNFSQYPLDHDGTNPAIASQAWYGTGCIASGNSSPVNHGSYLVNYGGNGTTAWYLGTSNAPPNVPTAIILGLSNPNLAFGACEKLFAQPEVVSDGMTDGDGEFGLELAFPHRPEFVGATLYSQGVAYDAGQSPIAVALSQGMRVIYPADAVQPAVATASQLVPWANPAWPTQHVFYRGMSLIFGLHE